LLFTIFRSLTIMKKINKNILIKINGGAPPVCDVYGALLGAAVVGHLNAEGYKQISVYRIKCILSQLF
jgi:hypothetical protein